MMKFARVLVAAGITMFLIGAVITDIPLVIAGAFLVAIAIIPA